MKHSSKTLLAILGIWLGASSASLGAETEGQIRLLEPEQGLIGLGDNPYTLSKSVHVRNLAGGANSQKALQLDQHVRLITNHKGELTNIWIFPDDGAKRKKLGYSSDESDE